MKEIIDIYRRNFPFISREEKIVEEIINNKDNVFFEERNNGNLIGCAIVNKNTIILLVVDKDYRNQGIGTRLLDKCEKTIIVNGYDKIILGVGFNYLMPGVPTSKKYVDSINENLDLMVNDKASNYFEKRNYEHSWNKCNCFDMRMSLSDFNKNDYSIGDTIKGVTYRWATIQDLDDIIICADDACQFQDGKFSKYYKNTKLYEQDNNQKVLVAIKNNKIVGSLIVSIETEAKNLGCVGCTCVMFSETHQGIATNMVILGTKYLKDLGLSKANLSYTYTGLDNMYGKAGYEISCYYMMAEKNVK